MTNIGANEYIQKYWGGETVEEERQRGEAPLVYIQTLITQVVLSKYLKISNINSILDAGAGTGRYSLPLGRSGYQVTHFDISNDMLELVKKVAEKECLSSMNFKLGNISDMNYYNDKSFDMSVSFDGPISYSYPNHIESVKELCRITNDLLIIMVSNKNGMIPFMIDFDVSEMKEFPPFYSAKQIINKRIEHWPDSIKKKLEEEGELEPADYFFEIDEVTKLINSQGFDILEIGGPGTLARSVKRETYFAIKNDEKLLKEFVQLSMNYDFDKNNIGLSPTNLLIVAKRRVSDKS